MDSVRVLHVDDMPDFAELVADLLSHADDRLDVRTEHSAEDALDRLEADGERIDCIVSDYDMPGLDGIEFLDAVRERRPEIPFILFTGKGSEEIASEAIAKGATDYLQKGGKPDQYDLLANRIRNAVSEYRVKSERNQVYQALETATEGVGIVDETGEHIYLNERYAALYGHDREDLVGESWELIYPGSVLERFHDEVLPALDEQGNWSGGARGLAADGTDIPERLSLTRLENGGHVRVVQDVTDRRERKRELARYERIVENLPIGVFRSTVDGDIASVNRAFVELFDADSKRAVVEMDASEFWADPAERDALLAELEQAGTIVERPVHMETLSGDSLWLDVTLTLTEDDGNRYLDGIFREVTEEERRGREWREHVDALEAVHEITTQADTSVEEKIEGVLLVGTDYLDIPYGFLTEIEFDDDADDFEGTQRIVEAVGSHDLLQPGESCPLDQSYCRKTIQQDGLFSVHDALEAGWEGDPGYELFELGSYIGGPIYVDDEVDGTFCFAGTEVKEREFTELEQTFVWFLTKWAQYELARSRKRAAIERQNERFDDLASAISHDLQTPLATARGRAELAIETSDVSHVERAVTAIDRVDELREDIVETLRNREIVGDTETVNVDRVAEEVWSLIEPPAEASLEVAESSSVEGDAESIQRLLQNLLLNTIEHGGEDVKVRVGAVEDGFYVEDDGPGVPAEHRDEVFSPGFSTKTNGTGVGMTSAQQIVLAHGWDIRVDDGDALGGARIEVSNAKSTDEAL